MAAFGREFSKPQRIPANFHRFLIEAQEMRITADYGQLNAVTTDQAIERIDCAEQFLEIAVQAISAI